MSLLTIVQDACRHPALTLPVLASVVGNTQSHAPAMLMAAKQELDSLATRCPWQALTKEHTFTATASSVQLAAAIPSDFDRMINESIFNRTARRHIHGPIDAVEWQQIQASFFTAIDPAYRFRGNTILITPNPASGDTIAYEYISRNKALSSGGAAQFNWQADADTTVFREDIVTLGVVWRYRMGKGYSYDAVLEEYERRVVDAISRDGSKPRLSTDAPSRTLRPYPPRVPETLTGLS